MRNLDHTSGNDKEALEKRVNKEWAVANTYDIPPPKLVKHVTPAFEQGFYYRAKCPVRGCKYVGLNHANGYSQHYARNHAPEQWRQHAKRVIKVINCSLAVS